MASLLILCPLTVICTVSLLKNAARCIPNTEFDSMPESLREREFDLFCNVTVTSNLLFTGKRSSSTASTRQGFKEGGLRCSELGTGGGVDLQGHSDAQGLRMECTASAVVRVRESNPYFCGMRPCNYFD
ncbi:hypothetical protein PIB30_098680 [Stylosanthes scabra]|uniref:Uncharacterized protein n=1 Tax=Stylosanthes scabra TaxID=79078 RepID=A0ABU6WZQ7_9FABA|nr:hypothetical protein [Stylosanthes scabra]